MKIVMSGLQVTGGRERRGEVGTVQYCCHESQTESSSQLLDWFEERMCILLVAWSYTISNSSIWITLNIFISALEMNVEKM